MPPKDFIDELKRLGFNVLEHGPDRVAFPYMVESGRFAGQTIQLGFIVPGDWNLSPPSGPHISPRLLPLQSGGAHPSGGVHDSPFGAEWQYWSRPIQHWAQTGRTVKDVIAHIRHLFDTQ